MYPSNVTLNDGWWCSEWTVAQQLVYQLANLLLAAAFIIPDNFRHHAKLFRSRQIQYNVFECSLKLGFFLTRTSSDVMPGGGQSPLNFSLSESYLVIGKLYSKIQIWG